MRCSFRWSREKCSHPIPIRLVGEEMLYSHNRSYYNPLQTNCKYTHYTNKPTILYWIFHRWIQHFQGRHQSKPSSHCLLWVALGALMPQAAPAPVIDDNGFMWGWLEESVAIHDNAKLSTKDTEVKSMLACISWLSFSRTSAPSVLSTCHGLYPANKVLGDTRVSHERISWPENMFVASSDDSNAPSWSWFLSLLHRFTLLFCHCCILT